MLHVSMDRLCTCEGLHCLPTDTVDSMLTFFAWRRQPRNVRSERHCRPHPHLAGGKEVQARGIVGIPPIRRRMSLHAPFRFFLSCPSCFPVFVSRPAGAEVAAVGAEMGRMLGAASALCTGYDAIRLEVGIRTQKGLSETCQTAPFSFVLLFGNFPGCAILGGLGKLVGRSLFGTVACAASRRPPPENRGAVCGGGRDAPGTACPPWGA